MSAKNWVFTLNNPTTLEFDILQTQLSDPDLFTYTIFQKEQGQEETPHFQGFVQCKTKRSLASLKALLGNRMHLEKMRGLSHQAADYCRKEEGRLEGPWEFGAITGKGQRSDLREFLEVVSKKPNITNLELLTDFPEILAKYPRFVTTAINTYQEATIPYTEFTPRVGWQSDLANELSAIPNPRTVTWYYDAIGNNGKSYFARNYRDGYGQRGFLVTGGRHSDIYYAYKRESIVFFDMARVSEDKVPYEVMENLKNGGFLSTKYESIWKNFNVPHVIVFANFKPDELKLSADRWNIITI